jgi:maltose alpha-D-glucosyltransferase/alpha-amylase
MLRSFHYAAYAALFRQTPGTGIREADFARLDPWANYWYLWVSAVFLKAYRETTSNAAFLPQSREEFAVLLNAYLLEKAVYELGYELNNRPDWVRIPIQGILQILETAPKKG